MKKALLACSLLSLTGSMIDGDGPENIGAPIYVQMRIIGNAQPTSQVTSAHLVAKIIQ
jgi:hypothetical protein